MVQIRILIVDDHSIFRQGLASLLRSEPEFEVVAEASSGEQALSLARQMQPDVILMDLLMPGIGGVAAIQCLAEAAPEIRVVVLTASEQDQDLFAAIQAGARGYLLKNADAEELFEIIRRVNAGQAALSPEVTPRVLDALRTVPPTTAVIGSLTDRERDVLRELSHGASNSEIARQLVISENTVKTHVAHVLEKLGLRNRGEAAAWARRNSFILG